MLLGTGLNSWNTCLELLVDSLKLHKMEKKDSLEVKVVQQKKNNRLKRPCKLFKKQQENGISPWKNAGRKKTGQQCYEAWKANEPLFSCQQQVSKPLLLSIEDGIEDFKTELTLFNDLVVTNDLKFCHEYLPYYRTNTNLLETHLDPNTGDKYENIGEGIQSNGCAFQPEYEDEPLKDMGTGYFPYYRSYEEYFSNSDLTGEAYSSVDSEEAETSSTEELGSVVDCEIEEIYEDTIIQENGETNENTSQDTDSLKLSPSNLFPIIEPCDSESSFFNEIESLNQPSFSRGYFPYYRTYEKIILSPEASAKMFSSSEDTLVEFGLDMEGTGDTGDYSSIGCSVC
ncbi:hypothetical protein lerEdw1_016234 [Lerista edwardsae]|nr:hypothetical protein lerEdw1_016234 [Lerista edwardsae]